MTIDDRLTRAGERFRASHSSPARVDLAAPAAARPLRRPPRRRLVGITVAAATAVLLTVGVIGWVTSSHRPADRDATAPDTISGTWTLVAVRDGSGDIPLPVFSRSTPQLRLDLAAGDLSVDDGCNDLDGTVSGDDTSLAFDRVSITAAGCPDDGAAFRAAIDGLFVPGTATYRVATDRLTISRDGTTLTFVDTVWDLAGTTWRLVTVDDSTLPPALQPTVRYTLSVSGTGPDQELRLDDSCNVTSVPVDVGTETITVTGQALTTAVGCPRPADPAASSAASVFGGVTISWSIAGNVLTVTGVGTGPTATFEAD